MKIQIKQQILLKKLPEFNKNEKSKGHPPMKASLSLDNAKHIKILTSKQMLQTLPIVLAQR